MTDPSMEPMPPFGAMEQEHRAWVFGVVAEFKRLGIDINDPKHTPLAKAIDAWGEELAWLRMRQDNDPQRGAWYSAKLQSYVEAREEPIPQGAGTIWDRLAERAADG